LSTFTTYFSNKRRISKRKKTLYGIFFPGLIRYKKQKTKERDETGRKRRGREKNNNGVFQYKILVFCHLK